MKIGFKLFFSFVFLISILLPASSRAMNTPFTQLLYNAGPKTSSEIFDIAWNGGALDASKKQEAFAVIQKSFSAHSKEGYEKLYSAVEKDLVKAGLLTFPSPFKSQANLNDSEPPPVQAPAPTPVAPPAPVVQAAPVDPINAALEGQSLNKFKIYNALQRGKLLNENGLREDRAVIDAIGEFLNGLPPRGRQEGLFGSEVLQLKEILNGSKYLK